MNIVTMQINGRPIEAEVEARMHLADFLRERQSLTGTNIGCEHGVCGACTILIDGSPARSCITYAVACEGSQVTTLEGLENDPIIVDLREAFSNNHALQCGYCTPGMLVSCRDIINRLPEADEARIRRELSGNLCRCTGYVGIVAAVKEVLKKRGGLKDEPQTLRTKLGPVGAHAPTTGRATRHVRKVSNVKRVRSESPLETVRPEQWRAVERDGVELNQSFHVPYPRDSVWKFFDDLNQVVRCMPGASLTKPPTHGRAEGKVSVKLGPIVSAFAGVVEVERDDRGFCGVVRGTGRDTKSNSNARALITYKLQSMASSTQVCISVKFMLTGALAQFSRSGLIRDVADHLTRIFAGNLEASLSGKSIGNGSADVLDAGQLARTAFWTRFRAFFRTVARRK